MLLEVDINIKNLQTIKKNIQKHSPYPDKVKIVAVTKTLALYSIQSAFNSGLFIIGESKIQETKQKIKKQKLNKSVEIHLIGHLQTNKAKQAVEIYNTIQSVDSIKIAEKINHYAEKKQKQQQVFLQIKGPKTPTPFGFTEEKIYDAAEKIKKLKNIKTTGVMMIAPNTKNKKTINKEISLAQQIKRNIKKNIIETCSSLSAGMSNDYILALQNGATHIRLGTLLYTKRQ